MNFRPEMVDAIRERKKTQTRRLVNDNPRSPWFRGRCSYRTDRRYAICPGRGKSAVGYLELSAEPKLEVVADISEKDARLEGFESRDAFLRYFVVLNGSGILESEAWALRFRVLEMKEAS